ncbi:MAG TPA: response regulator transcription factor [Oculatellaceae cyanobacterium]
MAKILLVDDDQALADMVVQALERDGHAIDYVDEGLLGCKKLLGEKYELAILDWQLPGKAGVDICAAARKENLTLPIMMLTGRNSADEIETGLDRGADDYLTKPFSLRELSARVKSLLRRPQILHGNELQSGDLLLSPANGDVRISGEKIDLTTTEQNLLEFLLRNKGKAFRAEELLVHVWKADSEVTLGAVATCIKRLRDKIEAGGRQTVIQTVHGIGYMISE